LYIDIDTNEDNSEKDYIDFDEDYFEPEDDYIEPEDYYLSDKN
jgi:hypothetical protein